MAGGKITGSYAETFEGVFSTPAVLTGTVELNPVDRAAPLLPAQIDTLSVAPAPAPTFLACDICPDGACPADHTQAGRAFLKVAFKFYDKAIADGSTDAYAPIRACVKDPTGCFDPIALHCAHRRTAGRHVPDLCRSPSRARGDESAGIRGCGGPRKVRAPDKTLLVVDHNVPTTDRRQNPDPESEAQIAYLAENAKLFGLEYYDEFDKRQGIVHIIGPEQGFTLPGVRWCAATATPRRMARSARSPTASAPRRSSTSWRRRR